VSAGSVTASLLGLPGRVGQLLFAPAAGMARVEREHGGLSDTWWLIAFGALTFRFARLLEALLDGAQSPAGALGGVARVAAAELMTAAIVVLPAAVIVTLLAGARRDSSRDLDLGAACYAPYFAVRAVFRAYETFAGPSMWPQFFFELPAAVAALIALVFAVRVARARTGASPAPVIAQPGSFATRAGLVVSLALVAGLAGNVRWATKNLGSLMPVRHGQLAPDFSLPRADGQPGAVALSGLRGRVVVLDFWATWCPPCNKMMPTLEALNTEWKERGVTFVGVNSDGDIAPEELRAFLTAHGVSYAVVADNGRANNLYKVRALPTLFIIGKDGRVRDTFLGLTRKASIASALEEATAAN
jgi:thiol-disulfide isomerase/thioredoxin